VFVHDLRRAFRVLHRVGVASCGGPQEPRDRIGILRGVIGADVIGRAEKIQAEIGHLQHVELDSGPLLEHRKFVAQIHGHHVDLARQELAGARGVVHLDARDLGQVELVDLGEGLEHVGERLADRGADALALEVLGAFELDFGKRDDAHRRARLVERGDGHGHPLAHRLRRRGGRTVADVFGAGGDQSQHDLRALAFGELDVEPFGGEVTLVERDEERRVFAFQLPREADDDFFLGARGFRLLCVRRHAQRGKTQQRSCGQPCNQIPALKFHVRLLVIWS
jgi:hypothetical protein